VLVDPGKVGDFAGPEACPDLTLLIANWRRGIAGFGYKPACTRLALYITTWSILRSSLS